MPLSLYYKHRPQMKSGDLLQWQSHSVLGWLIRKFSRGDVNHSGQVLDLVMYDHLFERRWTLEALESGLQLNLISSRLECFKGRVWWYPLRADLDQYRNKMTNLAIMRATEYGKRGYDFGSLFRNALGRVSTNARSYFCSEFVFLNGRDAGLPLDGWDPSQAPRPADMDKFGWWSASTLIHESV